MELLEREPQYHTLWQAWAGVNAHPAGLGCVVVISGEAGVGKTSLVRRFTNDQCGRCTLMWGTCDSAFTPRPLAPLFDIARQSHADLLPLLQSGADWLTIASAMLTAMEAAQSPTLLVLEDVHWADEATLDLVKYLARRIQSVRAMLVLTYRDDETGPQHKLKIVLGDLATVPALRRIQLAPLSLQAVCVLAEGTRVNPDVLYRQTSGNPFFVTEVLASEGGGIPATVRDAVLARAARLSRSARAVLEAAAVVGQRPEYRLLIALASSEIVALEECTTAGILHTQDDSLSFRHELARQAILDAISAPRRTILHGQILAALEVDPDSHMNLARLAHHAEGAGDPQAVLRYAPAAARQAAATNAHREAAAQYARALRYAHHMQAEERALLLEAYAVECNTIDQRAEGIAARIAAIEIWQELGRPLKQGENYALLMVMHFGLGQNEAAEQAARRAVEILEMLPPSRELALAYRIQAALRMFHRDQQEAIRMGEKAIALAVQFDDREIIGAAYNAIGSAWMVTDFARGREFLEKSLHIAQETGSYIHIINAYTNLGSAAGEVYRYREADRYLADGIAYALERDMDVAKNYMQAWQALAALHMGRWDEAGDRTREVLNRPGVSPISRIMALLALGRLRARRGDPGVWVALDEALVLAEQTQTLQRIAPARTIRAEAAWLAGDRARAREESLAAYDFSVRKQHPWFTGELAFWRVLSGEDIQPPEWIAEPFLMALTGDWLHAARAWEALGLPYERALALSLGDSSAQIVALEIFERLGARPAAEITRRKLHVEGAQGVPRGPRATTRNDPLQLTRREREVLDLLVLGLSNPDISGRLHLSTRTVEHHVTSIFSKLNVQTRAEAIALVLKHN